MRKMFSFQQYVSLNELRVHRSVIDQKGRFVSYEGNLWIFDEDDWDDVKDEIFKKIPIEHPKEYNDLEEWELYIQEEHPYILLGHFDSNWIYIENKINWRHSRTSKELKKVSDTLKRPIRVEYRKGLYMDDDDHFEEDFTQTDIFYHGTCFSALDDIFRKGLIPGKDSNFKILHRDKVFVTNLMEKALFHAETAARNKEDFPVILKLTIADPSKLVSDYDVIVDFRGTDDPLAIELGYEWVYRQATGGLSTLDMNKKTKKNLDSVFGTYGHIGRIPPSSIKNILIDLGAFDNFYVIKEIEGYMHKDYLEQMIDDLSGVSDWTELSKEELDRRTQRLKEENQYDGEDDYEED
jgi:hypothetical protein